MLITFKVSNFKSINKIQELSMIAGTTRNHPNHIRECNGIPVLNESIIYGANAAGKTSFISAMRTALKIILRDTGSIPQLSNMYCRLYPENETKETYFEFLFEMDGDYYYYGFEIILFVREITREWLYKYDPKTNSEQLVFNRECNQNPPIKFGEMFSKEEESRLNIYSEDFKDEKRETFLKQMAIGKQYKPDSSLNVFRNVYNWFRYYLLVDRVPRLGTEEYRTSAKILESLGTDVVDFEFVEVDSATDSRSSERLEKIQQIFESERTDSSEFIIDDIRYTYVDGAIKTEEILARHGSTNELFHISEESRGTREALQLSQLVIPDEVAKKFTVILDEYGSSMHPLLAYKFFEKYNDISLDKKCQLIIATHHTSLMSWDLFRRDEIWFIDKKDGESELYSLEEFEVRSDKKIDKAYMEGRFGALPIFKESVNGDEGL